MENIIWSTSNAIEGFLQVQEGHVHCGAFSRVPRDHFFKMQRQH